MNTLFRSADSLENEGDAREAYAAWLTDMKGVAIKSNTDYVVEKGLDFEVELIDFV